MAQKKAKREIKAAPANDPPKAAEPVAALSMAECLAQQSEKMAQKKTKREIKPAPAKDQPKVEVQLTSAE